MSCPSWVLVVIYKLGDTVTVICPLGHCEGPRETTAMERLCVWVADSLILRGPPVQREVFECANRGCRLSRGFWELIWYWLFKPVRESNFPPYLFPSYVVFVCSARVLTVFGYLMCLPIRAGGKWLIQSPQPTADDQTLLNRKKHG